MPQHTYLIHWEDDITGHSGLSTGRSRFKWLAKWLAFRTFNQNSRNRLFKSNFLRITRETWQQDK